MLVSKEGVTLMEGSLIAGEMKATARARRATKSAGLLVIGLAVLLPAVVEASTEIPKALLRAERWPQADSLFTRDALWLGGDGAATVDLGDGRILWLFGDSFIGTDSTRDRAHSVMVRNSVAIQYGRDPTSARIRFYWKQARGSPRSFFPEARGHWLWPGHGALQRDGLFIIASWVRSTKTGLGFAHFATTLIHVSNPQAEPDRWKVDYLAVPVEVVNGDSIAGVGAVLSDGSYIYAWFTYDDHHHNAYLARWRLPLTTRKRKRLPPPEWWTAEGWAATGSAGPQPLRLFSGATDFSVQPLDSAGGFLLTQTVGFGQAHVCYRTADRITGPWLEARGLHTPAECSLPRVLIYSANSHPELEGGDVVLTYNANSLNWGELIRNRDIYYPRFLRARLVRGPTE
jgi:hypothetical protein